MKLSDKETDALYNWARVEFQNCQNPLEVAGAFRNVIRHAEHWGPKLIAMLAAHGLLEPGDSPDEALEIIICELKEKSIIDKVENIIKDSGRV